MADNFTYIDADSNKRTVRAKDINGLLVEQTGVEAGGEVDGSNVALGSTTDTAWAGGAASSTVVAALKAISTRLGVTLPVSLSGTTPVSLTGSVATTSAASSQADGSNLTLGVTTGAAVVTDVNGTLQQYLRGLVKLLAGNNPIGNSAFTEGVDTSTMIGATFADSVTVLAASTKAMLRMTAWRALHVNLRNVGGLEVGTTTVPFVTQGGAAEAAAVLGNPTLIGARDPSGNAIRVAADAARNLMTSLGTGLNSLDDQVAVGTHTTGGATAAKLISAASTNATSVKGTTGTLYLLVLGNTNAAARYFKLYNKATAPTVGTDTPVHTYMIPGGGSAGATLPVPIPVCGEAFSAGIGFAITTGSADADNTGVAAGEITVNLAYA